jgi:glycosidase
MKLVIYQMLLRVFGNSKEDCVPNGPFIFNGSGKFSSVDEKILWHLKSLSVSHVYFTGVIRSATKTDFTQYGIPHNNDAVVKGRAGSPFAIADYYDVNPCLADKVPNRFVEFERMLKRVHSVGIKAIIDFVPNHVSREYMTLCNDENVGADVNIKEAASASADDGILARFGEGDNKEVAFDPQNNFYYMPGQELRMGDYVENPARATGNDCFTATPSHNDWYETVKLNYGVDYLNSGCGGEITAQFNGHNCYFNPIPKTWLMMYNVLNFWCSHGVDGFRCDMAEMVPLQFWEWAIGKIKMNYPKVIFIAESYNPQQYSSLAECGFDLLYDKVGLYDKLKGISRGEAKACEITSCWQSIENISVAGKYAAGEKISIKNRMLNFLENHDEQRVASDFNIGGDEKASILPDEKKGFRALPELVVSLMLNKSPFMLYFGEEFGEKGMESEGFSGRDGRTSIYDYCSAPSVARFLNCRLHPDEQKLFAEYVKLLHIAVSEKAISEGDTFDLEYANTGNGTFNPDRHFVFARRFVSSSDSPVSSSVLNTADVSALIFIAVDFTQSAKTLDVVLPAHLFDFWHLAEADAVEATDLLSGKSLKLSLRKDAAVSMPLTQYGVSIIKVLL